MAEYTTRQHVISGDVLQIVNKESDEHFGYTTEDVELEIEEDESSAEISTQRRRIRKRSYNEADLNVESLLGRELETLSEAGITDDDDNGRVVFDEASRTWEDGALIRVYEDVGNVADVEDEDPEQVVLCENVEWELDGGVDYSDDFAIASLSAKIHEDIYLDWDEEEEED